MEKTVLDGPAIPCNKLLAAILDSSDLALIVQQVHFVTQSFTAYLGQEEYHEGRWWATNSASAWKSNHFWWLHENTIRSKFNILVEKEILLTMTAPGLNQTKWYAVNYDRLDEIVKGFLLTNSIVDKVDDFRIMRNKMLKELESDDKPAPETENASSQPVTENEERLEKAVASISQELLHAINNFCGEPSQELLNVLYSKKERVKETPTPDGAESTQSQKPKATSPKTATSTEKKTQGKLQVKAKPAGMTEDESKRWDDLFYAISQQLHGIDFKSLPDKKKGQHAPLLHQQVSDAHCYPWMTGALMSEFIDFYEGEVPDANKPTTAASFSNWMDKFAQSEASGPYRSTQSPHTSSEQKTHGQNSPPPTNDPTPEAIAEARRIMQEQRAQWEKKHYG